MQGGDVGVQFSGWLAEFLAARLVARCLSDHAQAVSPATGDRQSPMIPT